MRSLRPFIRISAWLLVLFSATLSIAREQSTSVSQSALASAPAGSAPQQVFVFLQRTDRHAKYSSPEVFHNVLDDLLNYLKLRISP